MRSKGSGKGNSEAQPYGADMCYSAVAHLEPVTQQELQGFMMQYPVEHHAQAKLMALHPKFQRVVISRRGMEDARDCTAVLIKRISMLRMMTPGDWICSTCWDTQFARNTTCRKCGTCAPPNAGQAGAALFGQNPGDILDNGGLQISAVAHVDPATEQELQAFFSQYPVESHAEAKLRALDPRFQKVVMYRGRGLQDARDPTAVLIKRCADLTRLTPGDWICAKCYDVQFSKNTTCRMCSAPAPQRLPMLMPPAE